MKSKLLKRGLPAALSACMALTIIPSSAVVAMAADGDGTNGQKGGYVLMNIPYDEFYEGEGVADVDTVTTATVKTYNQTMAGGSYHSGSLNATDPDTNDPLDKAEILGITYPVYVEDLSVLDEAKEVTDASTATITVASGKSARTTKEVTGKDVLFANGDYSYYKLTDEPANYKTLTVNGDAFSFSSVKNQAVTDEIDSAEISYGGHYTPVNLTVADDKITDASVISAIIITSGENKYALRHVENIWRKTSLGWYWTDLDEAGLAGKDISNITYYLQDGSIYSYDVDLTVKKNAGDEITAAFSGEKAIDVTGLPDDIENPKATVKTKVGRGETPVVIAENVAVTDGKITTTDAAVSETAYSINIVSDNYADISVETIYTEPILTGWQKIDSKWYYYDESGNMVTDSWAKDSTGWCWMGSDGTITKNKWIQDNGEWYYLKANGYMAANEWAKDSGGWYYMNKSGKISKNAWAKDSKGWMYLGANGRITKNKWIKSGSQWYYMKANGYMAANEWAKDSGGWMYMDASGKITKNKWIKSGGKWYYLKANGYMATGTLRISGKTYTFDSSGRWIS